MYHKGTGWECVYWIHVTQVNVMDNKLPSCCIEDRGFLKKTKYQILKIYSALHGYLSYSCWVHNE